MMKKNMSSPEMTEMSVIWQPASLTLTESESSNIQMIRSKYKDSNILTRGVLPVGSSRLIGSFDSMKSRIMIEKLE